MHVLITADTVGGVWTYTQELVTGLLSRGHRVTLVSFGKLPTSEQTRWTESLNNFDYRPTDYRLEWMEVAERDIEESKQFLQMLIREVQPDLLHFSQYCYGDLSTNVPKIVVAHSDVISWWVSVHGCLPEDSAWVRRYRQIVQKGLAGADVVVAPSRWMLDAVGQYHHLPCCGLVIPNGRSPELFSPFVEKKDFAVTAGRVWDEGKNIALLLEQRLPVPIYIVGSQESPERSLPAERQSASGDVHFLGNVSQKEIRELLGRAAIYIAPSSYEPFGLAPLEAALSGCVLVVNDIPVFRELWGDCALFFRKNDAADLARVLSRLCNEPALIPQMAKAAYQAACRQFSAERMINDYENLYQRICSEVKVA
jgi:glycogen synthase